MSTPRAHRTARLAVGLTGLLAMLGAGALWALLAPVQQEVAYPPSQQAPDGQALSLPLESYYRFGSVAVFVLLSIVVGVVMGVAAWQIRFARGPETALALAAGTGAGSAIALAVGRWVHGGVADPDALAATVSAPTLVSRTLEVSWWSVVVAPAVALVLYTLAAAWHSDPDLGRPRPPAGDATGVGGGPEPVTAPIPVVPLSPADAAPRTDR